MVKVSGTSVVLWPSREKCLVISVMVLMVLIPTPVRAVVMCYYCDGCDVYMPTQMKPCETECSVWYSKNGDTTNVNRGCLEEAEPDEIISQCTSALCNTASVMRCVRCDSAVSDECETVICPDRTPQNKCYHNPADGHRGCISDPNYEADCTGSKSCTECSSLPGIPCNDLPRCVVCDVGTNPECPQDTPYVQQCPGTTDQCYRYRDAEQVVHVGCTSADDYTITCQGTAANCHTCLGEECNRDAKFECYTCVGCTSVDVGQVGVLAECNILEENRCYMRYDMSTKETHRGCFSDTIPEYNFFEPCDGSSCNDRIFPDHLQCYQCVDCTEVTAADAHYCSNTEATGCFMLEEIYSEPEQSKTLIRGCNTDEKFTNCLPDRNCKTCSNSNLCNGEPSQVQKLCDQCDGVVECEQPIANTPSCADSSFANRCYLSSDGTSAMKKGCVLDLDPTMADVCYDPSDARCKLCTDNQCNQKHCVLCDTRTDGMVCVVGDKTATALRYTLCAGDVCRMEIDAEGHTRRGCLEEFESACHPGSCVESIESGSNSGIFPTDRLKCFQCEGAASCWKEQMEAPSEQEYYCLLYRGAEDGCYIYNDGSMVVRGCTTDPEAMCVGDDSDPPEHCTVSLADLSNNAAQAPMTCYADCPGNVQPCSITTCSSSTDLCFVSVSIGGVITRGCTPTSCPADSKNCFKCNEPNCNGVYSLCSKCDTALETDCTVGVQNETICKGLAAGCFQYRDEDRTVYGCAEDSSPYCSDNEERCHYCEEPFCNTKALNLCYSCTDCSDVLTPVVQKTKLCTAEEDDCIIGFFEEKIDRGCQSELPHPFDDYLIIEVCTEPGCNQLSVLGYVSCYVCTDCPDEPNDESDAVRCLLPPSNRCYTKRESSGVISRGCANKDTLIGCVDGVNCEVCEQSYCNNEPIPRQFSCVQCERSDACADYNVPSDCPNTIDLVFDACVIHTADTQVAKGCLSSLDLFELCYDGSNNCTVTREFQGNASPVQCITCSGDVDCIRGDVNELPKLTFFNGSCVSFLDANGKVVRGNVVDYPECEDSLSCVECFTDVCNGGLFPDDRLLCYQCSGEQCARLQLATIDPEPCLRYDTINAKCYTWYESPSSAQRGCRLDDAVCESEGVLCQDCTDSGCNVLGYDDFDDTEFCVQCSSNRGCDESPAEETCNGKGGCYTFFLSTNSSLVIAKGCVSELQESMVWYDECVNSENSGRCERCYGDYCNRNRCYVCNSLLVGGSCIEPSVRSTESSTCNEIDECVAFIDDHYHTVRGCSESFQQEQLLECTETSGTCHRCKGDYCNGAPLPRDRIKCYQCTGTELDCLNPTKNSEQYCTIYREGEDSCYTYFQDETMVERGCTLERSTPCEQPCQQCNTTGCNNQPALVQNTLSCAQCSGDNCPAIDEPTDMTLVKPCPDEILFGRTDQCYSYFYPDGTLERGCLSRLSKSEEQDLAAQCLDASDVTCKLCSGNGCNARNVNCFVCDTDTFSGCADTLSETEHSAYVQACGTVQCVSVLEGTVTRKGCSEDYTVKCESDDEVVCETFDGSMSNSAIYPAGRLQCFQCQGSSSCNEIQTSSRSASVCQQYNANDECYTYVSDIGETYRGCVSDSPVSNPCIQQPDLCVRCNDEPACNNEPAIRSNELICAQCTRAVDCETMEEFERCTQLVLLGRPDSCYVQTFAGEVVARGCLSDAPASLRDNCPDSGAANSECSSCLCDRCNGPPVQCVSCEGETGCGEVLGTEAKLVSCQTGSCVSFVKHLTNGSSLIVKGCSEVYERDTCGKGHPSEASYQLCHSVGCNDVLFPAVRLKCYQCEGEACSDPSLEPTICEPYREGDMCYSFSDRQQKGCWGQLEDVTECTVGRCSVCGSSDGCNEQPRVLECIACSSKNDPGCVDPMATVIGKKKCLIGGCVTLIDADGHTVRGCANEYDATPESCTATAATTTCKVCTEGDACNAALFPANRLQCYQCSGVACLEVSQQQMAVCQRYSATDACYAYATSSTNIRRGCLSDPVSQCSEECVACTSSDGCNADPPIVPNALTCHRCEGPDCAMQQTGVGTVCPDILLGRTDACYSFVEKYSVRRGCLSEATTACNSTNPNCHVCTGESDCNAEKYSVTLHECVLCDEDVAGEQCKWGYDQTAAQRCTSDLSSSDVGCYTCYSTTAGQQLYHRGCAGEARQAQCQPGTVQVCLGAACNQRNEQLQICAKCEEGCKNDRWKVEECRGIVPYERRGCYIMLDSRKHIVARGCAADLNEDTWNLCSNVKDSSCITCLGNECNHADIGLRRVSLLWTLLLTALLMIVSNRVL
ncbi:uncharacterized protein LOC126560344 [Anopheles maculipalpis]|uniref:uncharacterized protein LOC126560344 n=1 Tax=Anopheles maculipalpis TaxID=1496333 RepID=UPI0021599B0B|nr:uncharacterized protein LOC126560344 [Anopheles maculipalpis]